MLGSTGENDGWGSAATDVPATQPSDNSGWGDAPSSLNGMSMTSWDDPPPRRRRDEPPHLSRRPTATPSNPLRLKQRVTPAQAKLSRHPYARGWAEMWEENVGGGTEEDRNQPNGERLLEMSGRKLSWANRSAQAGAALVDQDCETRDSQSSPSSPDAILPPCRPFSASPAPTAASLAPLHVAVGHQTGPAALGTNKLGPAIRSPPTYGPLPPFGGINSRAWPSRIQRAIIIREMTVRDRFRMGHPTAMRAWTLNQGRGVDASARSRHPWQDHYPMTSHDAAGSGLRSKIAPEPPQEQLKEMQESSNDDTASEILSTPDFDLADLTEGPESLPVKQAQAIRRRQEPWRFAVDSFAAGVSDDRGGFRAGFRSGLVESSLAFDPRKRAFLLDLIPTIAEEEDVIPPALELIDAAVPLEDIVALCLEVRQVEESNEYDVVVSLETRRPARFYVPVLDLHHELAYVPDIKASVKPEKIVVSERESKSKPLAAVSPAFKPTPTAKAGAAAKKLERKVDELRMMPPQPPKRALAARRKGDTLRETQPTSTATTPPVDARKKDVGFGGSPRPPKTKRDPTPPPEWAKDIRQTGVLLWRRATEIDFSLVKSAWESDAGPARVDSDVKFRVAEWLTYRIGLRLVGEELSELKECLVLLRLIEKDENEGDSVLKVHIGDVSSFPAPSFPPVIFSHIRSLTTLPYDQRYLIEGLVSHAIARQDQIEDLISSLDRYCPTAEVWRRVAASLYTLDRIGEVDENVRARFELFRNFRPANTQVVHIAKIVVTPTRVLLFPPEPDHSNSVLRQFAEFSDHFIRVQFNDEDDRLPINDSLRAADRRNPKAGPVARVRRILASGIEVAGRRYSFLASGASQSRTQTAWFLRDDKHLTHTQVLEWMGKLEQERTVAKYADRQALGFSSSIAVPINIKKRKVLDDVVRNGYIFTDGVGKCHQDVATACATALGVDTHPSAVQFRMGGTKGVLCVSTSVKTREVWLRKSQVKFESDNKQLHVVRVSNHSKGFLNRQFIVLLEALGVPRELFMELCTIQAKSILGVSKRIASDTERTEADVDLIQRVSSFPVRQLVAAGVSSDSILAKVTEAVERRLLAELRWQARLELEQGAYLLGVADDYDCLAEGEIFVQLDPGDGKLARVLEGRVIVCRAPSLHPGDIQIAQAVNRPQLGHLRNVVVFSVQGERPLPQELSGGDLDGDDFTVIWDPRFVNAIKTVAPADYVPAQKPLALPWVEQEDVKRHFVDHMLNDVLGIVANRHMAIADDRSPFSKECIELSAIYAVAIDAVKTGIPAKLNNQLRPEKWPDFMGKPARISYPGKSACGHIYRMVTAIEPQECFSTQLGEAKLHPLLRRENLSPEILELARRLKRRHDVMLSYVCARYKVTDIEVLAGIALRNGKRKRVKDQDLKDTLRFAYDEIIATIWAEARETNEVQKEGELAFALAAYRVGYEDDDDASPMHAFAWIGVKQLLEHLKAAKDDGKESR